MTIAASITRRDHDVAEIWSGPTLNRKPPATSAHAAINSSTSATMSANEAQRGSGRAFGVMDAAQTTG